MYKYLIIGIAFVFAVSGNYYVRKAGGAELISEAVYGEVREYSIPLPEGDAVGLYVCDLLSGCNNKHILLLKNDQTSELLQISNDIEITNEEISEITTEIVQDITQNHNNTTLDTSTSTENIETNLNNEVQSYDNNKQLSTTTVNNNEPSLAEEAQNSEDERKISSQLMSVFELDKNSTSVIEKGTWNLDVQNMLVVTIKERGTSTYEVPQKIVIKNIDESWTFSKISYTKSNYEDMINPTFIKQQ